MPELLWEGLYYSLHHPTSLIPYLRFTKIIISHYMTCFPDISRRARDMYHNMQDEDHNCKISIIQGDTKIKLASKFPDRIALLKDESTRSIIGCMRRNDEPNIPDTRLDPMSDKESPEVEITNDEEVKLINVVIPVNVNDEEEEITDEVYELKRREKRKIGRESRIHTIPAHTN
ncbi:hypothetical protein Tco_1393255 [Tanacetum coccineum]